MNVTAEEFNQFLAGRAYLRESFARDWLSENGTYDEWTVQLYKDIDTCVNALQASPELLQEDCEDRLTLDVLLQLRQQGYTATHDGKSGGHVDIGITRGKYTWIGEAKKDGNFEQGFLQLTTRYRPVNGDLSHNHGGLIFYLVKSANAAGLIAGWQTRLQADSVPCTAGVPAGPLRFLSKHVLTGPGTDFFVRTIGVSLYHAPQDKSGLKTAANRAARASLGVKKAPAKKAAATKTPPKSTAKTSGSKP